MLDKLTPYFADTDRMVLTKLIIILIAVLQRCTVCLNKLKGPVGAITGKTTTKVSSHYLPLDALFFWNQAESDLWLHVIKCGLRLLRLKTDYLVLDGTS